MADDIALVALVRKRAELAGRIDAACVELDGMLADIGSLDAALRLFDPDIPLEEVGPRPGRAVGRWAHLRISTRGVLGELRRAGEPIPAGRVVLALLAGQGADADDPKAWELATGRVRKILRTQRKRGLVRSLPGGGQRLLWEPVAD